jgi:Helix-loop-helix DNA-binding domain
MSLESLKNGSSNKLESRKIRKPKIEKMRRARINSSLESLKEILLRNTISIPQGSRPTKLEKADILEMTVRYIELLHDNLPNLSKFCNQTPLSSPSKIRDNDRNFMNITNNVNRYDQTFHQRQRKTHNYPISSHSTCKRFEISDDKENQFDINFEKECSMKEEHWRPW